MTRQISTIPENTPIKNRQENLVTLVDVSYSMHTQFGMDTRLVAAQNAVKRLAQTSSPRATTLSLITFSTRAKVVIPPTNQLVEFSLLSSLQVEDNTDIGAGIRMALELSPNRIILLSDGQATCPDYVVIQLAEHCRDKGIKIDCTAIGDANDALLKQISEITNGTFTRADTPLALEQHYARLESRTYLLEHKNG